MIYIKNNVVQQGPFIFAERKWGERWPTTGKAAGS